MIWPNRPSRSLMACAAALVTFVTLSGLHHLDQGLADNGDFARNVRTFSPGPAGIDPAPKKGAADWDRRYFFAYNPIWTFHLSAQPPLSSAVLLWLPGIALDALLISREVLLTAVATSGAKVAAVFLIMLLLRWILHQSSRTAWPLMLLLGLPATLLLSSADLMYVLNSFYAESGAIVFGLSFLLFIAGCISALPRRRTLWAAVASLLLLSTSRLGEVYWLVLGGIPLLVLAGLRNHRSGRSFLRRIGLASGTIMMLSAGLLILVARLGPSTNRYHALFMGTLTFSEDPQGHLDRLGMSDALDLVGVPAYTKEGLEARQRYGHQLGLRATANILVHEPAILPRMLGHVASQMQDVSIRYLGHEAYRPSSRSRVDTSLAAQQLRATFGASLSVWNVWPWFKFHAFPTGTLLYACLLIFGATFGWLWRWEDLRSLCLAGALATAGTLHEMALAIFGDGRFELMKHLIVANVLFDVALITWFAALAVHLTARPASKA